MVALAASSGLLTSGLNGQAATGTIQGTITDMSGAAVPNASVLAKNTGTGATETVTSDTQGRFVLPGLSVGTYDLQAKNARFLNHESPGSCVRRSGRRAVVDFSLPVGSSRTTVTVEGEGAQVETTTASVGSA